MDVQVRIYIQAHIRIKWVSYTLRVCVLGVYAHGCTYVFIHAQLAYAVNCFIFTFANTLKYRLTLLILFYA